MTDPRLYHAYARCEELGLIVCLHTGVNYTTVYPIANDHPLQLDEVACQFPDLVLVVCHAGWPWAAEMVTVMRKHPNVYADFGGLAPRCVDEDGTGWSVMRRFLNSLLAGQMLFATDWPVFPMSRALPEWRRWGSIRTRLTGCSAATPRTCSPAPSPVMHQAGHAPWRNGRNRDRSID